MNILNLKTNCLISHSRPKGGRSRISYLKKLKKPIVFVIFVVLCAHCQVRAQTTTTSIDTMKSDVVYLKDGSIFRGSILKYYPNATLKMRIHGGSKVTFHANKIERVVQSPYGAEVVEVEENERRVPIIPENGFTHTASLGMLNGTTPWSGDAIAGLSLHYTLGYQFAENYNVGVGSGVDYYYLAQREMLVPVFLQMKRTFPWKPSFQPFISMAAGYGFGLTSEDQNVIDAEGGFLWHPAVGVALGSSKDYHWQLDVGYRWQEADFTFENQWWNRATTTHEMTYKRFVVRWSLSF